MNIACTQKEKPGKDEWQYINDVKTMTIIPTGNIRDCIVAGEGDNDDPYILLNVPGAMIKVTGHSRIEVLCNPGRNAG